MSRREINDRTGLVQTTVAHILPFRSLDTRTESGQGGDADTVVLIGIELLPLIGISNS